MALWPPSVAARRPPMARHPPLYMVGQSLTGEERRRLGQLCEIEMDGGAASVRRARSFVDVTLGAWELGPLRDLAVLLTSELVTNAVVHARTPVRLTVYLDEVLTVEVADGSPVLPVAHGVSPEEDRGRGLSLVARLADRWGSRREGDGKVVWFVLEPPAGGQTDGGPSDGGPAGD